MRASVTGNPSAAALAVAGLTPPDAVQTRLDVLYGTVEGHELRLDLYLPHGEQRRPGVLFIHGGAWHSGSREHLRWHAEQVARLGFVGATASYRLSGTATWPAGFADCQRAVRWLRRHADELGLEPDRLGAVGSSAGGHLVALLGVRDTLDDSDLELAGLSSRVQCVVDYHGIHDFAGVPDVELKQACAQFLGGTFAAVPEHWHAASPLEFVDERSAPMMILHDPDDPTVPYDQSVRLASRLMEAAVPVEFVPLPGAGHGFVYSPEAEWTTRTWPWALAWLARYLV